jgi:tetratricopeptide (TPR) repeat protein
MAWNYLVIGRRDKAKKCVQWALTVAPTNRYVLRSACRFYIHCSEHEQAKRLLIKSGLSKTDPWIAAALVSVEQALKKAPSQIRPLHELGLNQNISPLARSELLAALADFHNGVGERKRSKKLFTEALFDPTDNALAQAINWISVDAHEEAGKILKLAHVNAPYEAETVVHYYNEDWDRCLEQVRLWRLDQPFSGRPYIFQSFLLSVVKADYGTALQVAHDGLVVDPDDETLRNNQAFSLINLGKYDQAHKILAATQTSRLNLEAQIAHSATSGLYVFRTAKSAEQITDARDRYARAVTMAKRDVSMKFRGQIAAMFELMEEVRLGIAITAEDLKKVETLSQKTRDPAVSFLSKKVLSTVKDREKVSQYPSKLDPTGTFELPPPVKLDFPE